ncbi:MAG: carboxypeptidase-like regulatory domain-containing protein, partial [Burkholderiales bacterium]
MRLILLTILASALAWSQSSTGSIQGRITDAQDALVPGAKITVTNDKTNVLRSLPSNDQGLYVVPLLPPGSYSVAVERDGFKRSTRRGIVLQVSDQLTVDFRLEVGGVVEQITIEGQASLVNATNPSLGQVIENRRIVDLPLNGRDPFSLATLAPGVLPPPTTGLVHLGGSVPSLNGASNFTSEVTV